MAGGRSITVEGVKEMSILLKEDTIYEINMSEINDMKMCNSTIVPFIIYNPLRLVFSRNGSSVYEVDYFPYLEGKITECKVSLGHDIMSGPFSGCWLARYRREGIDLAGHIEKVEKTRQVIIDAWNTFCTACKSSKKVENRLSFGFNPSHGFEDVAKINNPPGNGWIRFCYGIITNEDKCYTLFTSVNGMENPNQIYISSIVPEESGDASVLSSIFKSSPCLLI
jgi:hypothetical protein